MPLSKVHKQQTHKRVLQTAARAFRARGINGVGIADLMGQAGLTHGGFYAHFSSKDALVAAACVEGLKESSAPLLAALPASAPGSELATFVRSYLSGTHRDHPETGCIIASLGPEIVRSSPEIRQTFTEALESYIAELAPYADGETRQAREDAMYVLLAGMAGALLVSRAVDDPGVSDRILRAARRFFTESVTESVTGAAEAHTESEPPASS